MATYLVSTHTEDHRVEATRLGAEGVYTTFYNQADALVFAVPSSSVEYIKLESE